MARSVHPLMEQHYAIIASIFRVVYGNGARALGEEATGMTKRIGVMTSGGDAPGMNAAVRAVVRACINRGAEIFAIYEGFQGMIDGGDRIRRMKWEDVGGILHKGGTIIGTARCQAFRTREGRRVAVKNLLANGIDGLV